MVDADSLNADVPRLDRAALDAAIVSQGEAFQKALTAAHAHLFADVVLLITDAQLCQMRAVIAAVENVVVSGQWQVASGKWEVESGEWEVGRAQRGAGNNGGNAGNEHGPLGVFYGYDFHLNAQGAHLIEINTNAGGAFLNALQIASQRDSGLPGKDIAVENIDQDFLAMFRSEWRLARGSAPLTAVAIVDEQPESQYLYPEFLLAQQMFERAGIVAHIVDPAILQTRPDGLYCNGQRIDLIYNRLTDFSLQLHPELLQAYLDGRVVLTPGPAHYARYADKRNLARLSDVEGLRSLGASETDIATLQAGVPHTIVVRPEMEETLWTERKNLFFKPNSGYGSKGAYRGEKLTRRVFGEIMQADYVAQQMAVPGEMVVCAKDGSRQPLKFDVRCYVYDRQIQLVAARLYQGQTTNFRTPGGGFAPVRVLG